jgi:hypothetical protein
MTRKSACGCPVLWHPHLCAAPAKSPDDGAIRSPSRHAQGHQCAAVQLLHRKWSRLRLDRKNSNYPWPLSHGGEAISGALITLVVRGNRNDPVHILDMHTAARCEPPLSGALFYSPNGDPHPNASVGFDLDSPQPVARGVSEHTAPDWS